mmetsp:Transcript_75387/g.218925  ORF Transcript_75387/g.218925 Transcript_75387/m.218925 type:complete len:259 (-) Transcript_75387:80-856(-)
MLRRGRDEGDLHAAERQHAQNGGDGHFRLAAFVGDEDQQARAVCSVEDHVASDAKESLVLGVDVVRTDCRPRVRNRLLPGALRRARHALRPLGRQGAGRGDDVQRGKLRGALGQRRLGHQRGGTQRSGGVHAEVRHAGIGEHGVRASVEQRRRRLRCGGVVTTWKLTAEIRAERLRLLLAGLRDDLGNERLAQRLHLRPVKLRDQGIQSFGGDSGWRHQRLLGLELLSQDELELRGRRPLGGACTDEDLVELTLERPL